MEPTLSGSSVQAPNSINLHQVAINLAREGWPVFPCVPLGKEPLTPDGFKSATTDPVRIDKWWNQYPDANPAIYPGTVGAVVLDLDVKGGRDGKLSLFELEMEHGPLDNGAAVETPSGGLHIYLHAKEPISSSRNKLGNGIDVRANGGYVLAPGAILPNGRYKVAGSLGSSALPPPSRLPRAPRWVTARCQRTKSPNGSLPGGEQEIRIQTSPEAVERILAAIPPNIPYTDWVSVACCLRTIEEQEMAGPDFDGHGLWLSWSEGGLSEPDPGIPRDRQENDGYSTAADKWHYVRGSGINPRTLETIARRHSREANAASLPTLLPPDAPERTFAAVDTIPGLDGGTVDEDDPGPRWPEPLDLSAMAHVEPDPPRFIVKDWFPAGYATMLSGHGGVGKSYIGLHLAVCMAMGIKWWGRPTARKKVLLLSCEDRAQVIHWRLRRICEYMKLDMADLAGRLHIIDLVGHNTIVWDAYAQANTPATRNLVSAMESTGSEVVMADGISDVYAGNENDRAGVKGFVNTLLRMIDPEDGAVFLLGHVSKPIAMADTASGNGYSGTTQWHNAVRARWYLYPEQEPDEDERMKPTGDLTLELQKSNLGSASDSFGFRWNEEAKMFTATGEDLPSVASIRRNEEQQAIVDAVKKLVSEGVRIVASRNSPANAYVTMLNSGHLPDSLIGERRAKRRFWDHVEKLVGQGVLSRRTITKENRHNVDILEIGAE